MDTLKQPTIAVINSDKKQEYLYHYLLQSNYNVMLSDTKLFKYDNIADIVVAPTPLNMDSLALQSNHRIRLFAAGKISSSLKKYLVDNHVHVLDFLSEKKFIQKNCMYTAEGLLSYIISNTPFSLYDSKILIIGLGNCGKYIAESLSFFTNRLTILEQNPSKLSYIRNTYQCYENIDDMHCFDYDIIINTVPKNILDHYISQISKETYIFDIASPPYGISDSANINLLHSHRVSKIPLSYMPKSSAKLIGDILIDYISSDYPSLE